MVIILGAHFIRLRSQGWKQLSLLAQVLCSGETRVSLSKRLPPTPQHPLNDLVQVKATFWL